jgi:hypothetical protein
VIGLGILVVALFGALDGRLHVIGWRSQALALVLFEGVVVARIALRLSLLAGQLELQRGREAGDPR